MAGIQRVCYTDAGKAGEPEMEGLCLEPYRAAAHREGIAAMLRGDSFFSEDFEADVDTEPTLAYVAVLQGQPVGFLRLGVPGRAVDVTVYVDKAWRRQGIGTQLIRRADALLQAMEGTERALGACRADDPDTLQFVYRNGYYISHTSFLMERTGPPLAHAPIDVRPYQDGDYLACKKLQDTAFYHMRARAGLWPNFYALPSEAERMRYAQSRDDRFVLWAEDEIIAVAKIGGNEIDLVSVRDDRQGKGYGRAFVSWLVNKVMERSGPTVTLWVVKGNFAQTLYEQLGFASTAAYHFLARYYRPDTRLSAPPEEEA